MLIQLSSSYMLSESSGVNTISMQTLPTWQVLQVITAKHAITVFYINQVKINGSWNNINWFSETHLLTKTVTARSPLGTVENLLTDWTVKVNAHSFWVQKVPANVSKNMWYTSTFCWYKILMTMSCCCVTSEDAAVATFAHSVPWSQWPLQCRQRCWIQDKRP